MNKYRIKRKIEAGEKEKVMKEINKKKRTEIKK